jgi:uncharacterized membrane protein
MIAFRIPFTLAMLVFPLAFTLFFRPRPESDLGRVRRRRRNLCLATVAALGIYGLLLAGRFTGSLAFWRELPRMMTWSDFPDEIGWVLFFPLWFAFAMPLFAALRPESASPWPEGAPARSAALVVRTDPAIPARHWVVAWAVWGAALAVLLAWGETSGRILFTATIFLAGGAFPLALSMLVLPRMRHEPEPLDPAGSDELLAAYARLREDRTRAMFWLAVLMSALFTAMALAVCFFPSRGGLLGVIGGVGGTLVGIGGAVVGVRMGQRRMEIRRLLDRLSA